MCDQRSQWVATPPDDLRPGDDLEVGRIVAKAWGGPIGIDAWRFVLAGQARPYWVSTSQVLLCRRTAAQVDAALVAGVVSASHPDRPGSGE